MRNTLLCPHCREEFADAAEWASHIFSCCQLREIPSGAIEYSRHMSHELWMCGEVMIVAFAHYAQIVGSVPCADGLYRVDDKAKAWFEHGRAGERVDTPRP